MVSAPRPRVRLGRASSTASGPRSVRGRRVTFVQPPPGEANGARVRTATTIATLLTALAAVAALIFSGLQVRTANMQAELTREGQITDRYTRAVAQLGESNLNVRMGGIYALERLARDSPKDQPTIVDVLAAYVRDHALLGSDPACRASTSDLAGAPPPSDIAAALTALGRRDRAADSAVLDFSYLCLPYRFPEGDFSRTSFAHANLADANLANLILEGADFSYANAGRTSFGGADLAVALFIGTDLMGASFFGCDMERASFNNVTAERADFSGARLREVDFATSNLANARFHAADLAGAIFGTEYTGANVEGADFSAALDVDLTGARGRPFALPVPTEHN
jgi:uncharacterized protein YjbI with pentapeptide repeats